MKCASYLRLSAIAVVLCGVAACDAPPERAPVQPSVPAEPDAPAEQAAADQSQAQPQTQVIDRQITWPAAAKLDQDARAALSEASRNAVDQAPVPVFVVARSAWLAKSIVTRGPRFAAVSSRHDGLTVSLHGTARAHRYGHIKQARGDRNVRGHDAFVTQNERIWSAAWIEGNVAYSLELECDQLPDPRCEDDSYLLQLTEALAYVGGRQGAQP